MIGAAVFIPLDYAKSPPHARRRYPLSIRAERRTRWLGLIAPDDQHYENDWEVLHWGSRQDLYHAAR